MNRNSHKPIAHNISADVSFKVETAEFAPRSRSKVRHIPKKTRFKEKIRSRNAAVIDATFPKDDGLSAADFMQIAVNGFGEPENAYAHSMAYFRDQLFVGTTRHSLALLKLFPPLDPPLMDPWPVKTPARVEDLDMHGQIWRWTESTGKFEKAFTSPEIDGKNGVKVPRDLGYRGMAIFQGRSDTEPSLYVAAISTVLRGSAARILRSTDGVEFSPVSEPGLGNPNISTFRALAAFDGHLYAPPAGEGVNFNSNRASVIKRSADPVQGSWESACESGFGDLTNNGIFELVIFNGHLYAGTFNHFRGYQIWKTAPSGSQPCRWVRVLDRGAGRGQLNEIAMSMCVFNGALYVGSGIQNGGYDRYNWVGPAAGEIICIYPDDSWELLVGSPRQTIQGKKYPLSGMGPGFDNIFAGYIWRMVVHEGWLYASTFDWSVFLQYAQNASPTAKSLVKRFGINHIVQHGAGFSLWRTRDGRNWIPVTESGLGNPYNYGARTLVSTPYGLFVGTANPFGPEIAVQTAAGTLYVPNPRGGAEVWLGRSRRSNNTHRCPQSTDSFDSVSNELSTSLTEQNSEHPVLLTGASGFIGSHVLECLLQTHATIRVFDLPKAVKNIRQSDRIKVVSGDLCDNTALDQAVRGITKIFHLAALLPGSSAEDLREVNVRGTENLLRACKRTGDLQRLIFASSVAVYQSCFSEEEWPLSEASRVGPTAPEHLREYGRSKVAAETLIRKYAAELGCEFVILRPTTCYGIGSTHATELVQRILTHPQTEEGPAGDLVLQWIHVRDLAEVISRADSRPDAINEVFNIAGVDAFSYRQLIELVRRFANENKSENFIPDPSRTWQRYLFPYDIRKAKRQLGFVPRVSLQEGFAELVRAVVADAPPGTDKGERWRVHHSNPYVGFPYEGPFDRSNRIRGFEGFGR